MDGYDASKDFVFVNGQWVLTADAAWRREMLLCRQIDRLRILARIALLIDFGLALEIIYLSATRLG